MKLSIYRKIDAVREEYRAKNQKARWGVIEYHVKGKPIVAIGVDLELEYWAHSVAEGEVVLDGEVVWFSDPKDADRFADEFLPSIEERMKVQSFVKPFDDLYEMLEYAKAGNPVKLECVVPVKFQDFFATDEGDEPLEAGVTLWLMLRAGCVGRVFYFAQENSFAFENETDAVLLAAYLTDAEKTYGDEVEKDAPAQKRQKKAAKKKEAEDQAAIELAKWEYMRKMAEIMEEQENAHRRWHRPMWGIDRGNLSDFDLTSITIGDAYNPDAGSTSTVSPRHRDLTPELKPGLPSYRTLSPWPSNRDNLRDYFRTDPKRLRGAASATLRASLSGSSYASAPDVDDEEKVA